MHIGLVYTEKMIDTQMSWLHILVKDRGSTFIVILKTFLQGKLFCFSFALSPQGSPPPLGRST